MAPVIHPPGWDPNSTALALQAVQGRTIPAASRSWVPMTAFSLQTSEWQLRHEDALPPYRPNAGYLIGKETAAWVRGSGRDAPKAVVLALLDWSPRGEAKRQINR